MFVPSRIEGLVVPWEITVLQCRISACELDGRTPRIPHRTSITTTVNRPRAWRRVTFVPFP